MTKPRKNLPEAVALRYDRDAAEGAPSVVARGRGEIADRILETAIEAGVPIREDKDLLELLSMVELGEEIPVEVFGAVAQLISFLWGMNEERRAGEPEGR
ncbi:EscU/YscU/HrcU family type III secretion system export apparatus switch protein [Planctomycetota bacterium]|jgi:flagellar biosynthesis protein|nr:EscU/YscU/HrcU family type III secretion system export apparatus switch protein [Planctomycetota bacterium]MDB4736431.1 EscU/YscU/HrcU family type III secretion system export apparatus switch protein [Planctomycetota bacterium]